jgi:hypothetical protein
LPAKGLTPVFVVFEKLEIELRVFAWEYEAVKLSLGEYR